ncbi:MAG: amidohydrolase family protein [Acidobacteria bacterium]|nr:amidohydrolase family protein [Acidobacteriota bacterium]
MRQAFGAVSLALLAIALWNGGVQVGPDLILHGARVYTMDESRPWASAVAIQSGVVAAVGDDAEVLALAEEGTIVRDLGGQMILPGFHDVHVHAVEAGINADLCFFPSSASLRRYEQIARACGDDAPDADWVLGAGVFVADLVGGSEAPIDVLDRAIPDRPALILDDLGHGAWANTAALRAAGYEESSVDPRGGILHRDSVGELSGIVFENAQQRLRDAAWPPNRQTRNLAYSSLLASLEELNRNGITSVSDAGGYWTRAHHTAWARALRRGKLTVRATNALYVYPDLGLDAQLKRLRTLYSNRAGSLLRFNTAKIYVDGILDLGTSLLAEPYLRSPAGLDLPDHGFEYFGSDLLDRYAAELTAAGFDLHFHATGDAGVAQALDAIEAAGTAVRAETPSHRVTHLYLVEEADRLRFASLGVAADLQFSPDAIDPRYARSLERIIGRQRAAALLPARSIQGAGATTVLSSDWDAGPLSPLGTIQRALTRRGEGVRRLEDAIRMLTLDAARVLGQDEITGSIEVGKQADLVVLDRDLFAQTPARIGRARVLLTLLAGRAVFDGANVLSPVPAGQSSRSASMGSIEAAR